jgi:hypothetical protein
LAAQTLQEMDPRAGTPDDSLISTEKLGRPSGLGQGGVRGHEANLSAMRPRETLEIPLQEIFPIYRILAVSYILPLPRLGGFSET